MASGSSEAARPELSQVIDPLAAGSAAEVLVAVSALLSGGWGAQPLATELIDDLRQVFLAALAPDLCAVAGAERDRYTGLAEAMGLPRVVRSIEILGQALIDMREAPDAQVVLEIALVRAVRPDLDSGMEALSERVAVLERSVAGAPAFPRPGATGVAALRPRRPLPLLLLPPRRPRRPRPRPTLASARRSERCGGARRRRRTTQRRLLRHRHRRRHRRRRRHLAPLLRPNPRRPLPSRYRRPTSRLRPLVRPHPARSIGTASPRPGVTPS